MRNAIKRRVLIMGASVAVCVAAFSLVGVGMSAILEEGRPHNWLIGLHIACALLGMITGMVSMVPIFDGLVELARAAMRAMNEPDSATQSTRK